MLSSDELSLSTVSSDFEQKLLRASDDKCWKGGEGGGGGEGERGG